MKKDMKKNNNFFKKNLNTIILIGALVLLMIGLFFASKLANKVYMEEITINEYNELKNKEDIIVYFGTLEGNYKLVKESSINGKIKIYYVNTTELEKESERIEVWQNKNLKDKYDFSKIKPDSNKKFSINEITIDQYFEKIKTNNVNYMVIGKTGCDYCTYYREYISETPKIKGVDVNYVDLSTVTESDYNRLIKSDSQFNDFRTPLTLIYINGKRVDYVSGYITPDVITQMMQKNLILQYLSNVL